MEEESFFISSTKISTTHICTTGESDPQFDTVIDGPHCGLRGAAAKVSSVGTRSTAKRRRQCPFRGAAKAPSSAGTRKSVQVNLKNVASTPCKRSQHSATRSLDSATPSHRSVVLRAKYRYKHIRKVQRPPWSNLRGEGLKMPCGDVPHAS